jgi:hypothetical protein
MVGRLGNFSLITAKKAERGWHHHSHAMAMADLNRSTYSGEFGFLIIDPTAGDPVDMTAKSCSPPTTGKVLGAHEAIARTLPLVLRDMERVCASCQHKRQCDHDIAAGTSGQHYKEYCGNAATINSLGQKA